MEFNDPSQKCSTVLFFRKIPPMRIQEKCSFGNYPMKVRNCIARLQYASSSLHLGCDDKGKLSLIYVRLSTSMLC